MILLEKFKLGFIILTMQRFIFIKLFFLINADYGLNLTYYLLNIGKEILSDKFGFSDGKWDYSLNRDL